MQISNQMPVVNRTVQVTQFNHGLAGRIFDELKDCGTMLVLKHGKPKCVMLSVDEYYDLVNKLDALKSSNL